MGVQLSSGVFAWSVSANKHTKWGIWYEPSSTFIRQNDKALGEPGPLLVA